MERITVRLPQGQLDAIEQQVAAGLYPTKSEAIRNAVREEFADIIELDRPIDWTTDAPGVLIGRRVHAETSDKDLTGTIEHVTGRGSKRVLSILSDGAYHEVRPAAADIERAPRGGDDS